jgi:hypothetical protein
LSVWGDSGQPSVDVSTAALVEQTQIVTPSPSTQSIYPGQPLAFDVNYNTSTSDATLTGLGLRIHYNSSRLSYDSLSSVFGSPTQLEPPTSDTGNYDGDASTDKYVLVTWADIGGEWPGSVPVRLFTANFDAVAGATGTSYLRFSAASTAGGYSLASTPLTIQFLTNTNLVGRRVFYNNSSFDGNSAAANAADDNAIATDKTALLPGGQASFANYTSYSRGLNGVMVDFDNLSATPTLSDFQFKVGNTNNPSTWTSPSAAPTLTVRSNVGASQVDRVTLNWNDGVIAGQWLQVTVLASSRTGLAAKDVFYFGNAPGETGNSSDNALIDSHDYMAARTAALGTGGAASITSVYDINRDAVVNATDMLAVRSRMGHLGTALALIAPSSSASLVATWAAVEVTGGAEPAADTAAAGLVTVTDQTIDPMLVTVPVQRVDAAVTAEAESAPAAEPAVAVDTVVADEDFRDVLCAAAVRLPQVQLDLFADTVEPLVSGNALQALDAILQQWDATA